MGYASKIINFFFQIWSAYRLLGKRKTLLPIIIIWLMGTKLAQLIERLFKEHKLMRRFVMFWCMGIITFVVVHRPDMDPKSFASIAGLLTIAIGLYQWDKKLERDHDSRNP